MVVVREAAASSRAPTGFPTADTYPSCSSGTIEAVVGNERVGSMSWTMDRGSSKGDFLSIKHVDVDPLYQRRGVGERMYRELCKVAVRCKADKVHGFVYGLAALRLRERVFGKAEFTDWYAPPGHRYRRSQVYEALPEMGHGEGNYVSAWSDARKCRL